MKSTSGHFSFLGFIMGLSVASFIFVFLVSVISTSFYTDLPDADQDLSVLGLVGTTVVTFLIIFVILFVTSIIPFALIMRRYGHFVHAKRLNAVLAGCITGMLTSLTIAMFISIRHWIGIPPFEIISVVLSSSAVFGGVSGLVYFEIAKRDPRWHSHS